VPEFCSGGGARRNPATPEAACRCGWWSLRGPKGVWWELRGVVGWVCRLQLGEKGLVEEKKNP